jgi:hypothetical protein
LRDGHQEDGRNRDERMEPPVHPPILASHPHAISFNDVVCYQEPPLHVLLLSRHATISGFPKVSL